MGTLFIGDNERESAKRRRQNAYAKDLELQMREKEAAKLRERYQGMSVDASGWLDPEKRPDRLKPLGGEGFMTSRRDRDSKVRPYHTLFLYGKVPNEKNTPRGFSGEIPDSGGNAGGADGGPLHLRQWHLSLDTPAGLMHQPLTEATAGRYQPNDSIHQAYNFYATRDIDRAGGYGSIVQPLVVPYVDNRPIIMPGRYDSNEYHPKYNPFEHNNSNNDGLQRDIRALLGLTQIERDRSKAQLAKDNDDQQRRMRKELEDERRRLMDQENDARRRMEQMTRDLEARKREWERQMREAERAKQQVKVPKSAPITVRPPSTTLLSDMDDTRRRLIEERKIIEELLRAQRQPEYTEVKILKRPPPPPTPPDSDLANRRIVEEFNYLKHIDVDNRKTFRHMYPDLPKTNINLEAQQRALLRQQEEALRSLEKDPKPTATKPAPVNLDRRPRWMDKSLTPLPHRVRHRDRLYTAHSLDGDLDRIYSRAERQERTLESTYDEFEKLRLRSNRPASAETLTDDTWMRPASAAVI
ncbi:hypothetical protein BsWGS_20128 [Bradybaena similaris]